MSNMRILLNEILDLNFPLSLALFHTEPCCSVPVRLGECTGKEGEDGCGWGVKVTVDFENNLHRYSCFLTAVLSSLHSRFKLQFP